MPSAKACVPYHKTHRFPQWLPLATWLVASSGCDAPASMDGPAQHVFSDGSMPGVAPAPGGEEPEEDSSIRDSDGGNLEPYTDAGAHADGAVSPDMPADAAPPGAPACIVQNTKARCESRTIEEVGVTNDLRRVYWAKPTLPPPDAGYPAVILYQGSFFGPATTWDVDVDKASPFGAYHQLKVVAELLERGFVVIQPEAEGGRFWSTNVSADFASSADGVFIPLLLDALEDGTFGKLDLGRLYATGMSSGGYMTSRMAVSFPGRFRALAIHSAAYANCGGAFCLVPSNLPADHPPTIFLHGVADSIVPISTAQNYHSKLKAQGIETTFVQDEAAGHEWLAAAPGEIASWFTAH